MSVFGWKTLVKAIPVIVSTGAIIGCNQLPPEEETAERSYVYLAGFDHPGKAITRIDVKTGLSSQVLDLTENCIAADVDPDSGDIYIYTAGHIRRYDFSGKMLLDIHVTTKINKGREYIAYDEVSKCVGLLDGEGVLYFYDAVNGSRAGEMQTSLADAKQFLLDGYNSCVWIISGDGHRCDRLPYGSGPGRGIQITIDGTFYHLSNDPFTNSIVMGVTEDGRNYLLRLYNNIPEHSEYNMGLKPRYVCVNPIWGDIWVSDGNGIQRLDVEGKGLPGYGEIGFKMGSFNNNGSVFFGLTATGQPFAVCSSTLRLLWAGPTYGSGNDIHLFKYRAR